MAKDPSFPFYAQDYLIDTMRWDRNMKSLHIDLLAESWINGWLKDDNNYPQGLNENDRLIFDKIRHKWVKKRGVWINNKLLECKCKREEHCKMQKINGLKGGRPRNPNKTQTKPNGFENGNPNESQKNPLENENENEYIIQEEVRIKAINNSKKKEKEKLPKEKEKSKTEKPEFENESLQKAWCEWERYRTEIRHPMKSAMSMKKQIDFLNDHPPDEAVAIINQSITNQWHGLFEIKNNANGHAKHINGNSKTSGLERAIEKLRNQVGK